ncbi:uncharacterized protein LOC141671772 [Apium graveolens]|uniref:uncharacterized protein LOC141671772 n=1 Tax=Apium graveolens TaxID=4045 RepID=UPI003D7905C9
MADNNFPIERREESAGPVQSPVASSCSSRMRRTFVNDTDNTQNVRKTWPNSGSLLRWMLYERMNGRSRDPDAAAEKLWRKREKRLIRAQLESNKNAPANLAKM